MNMNHRKTISRLWVLSCLEDVLRRMVAFALVIHITDAARLVNLRSRRAGEVGHIDFFPNPADAFDRKQNVQGIIDQGRYSKARKEGHLIDASSCQRHLCPSWRKYVGQKFMDTIADAL